MTDGKQRHAAPPKVQAQIQRPPVTAYTRIIAVPVFPSGEAGPPSGSQGEYEVVFVLGVPGVNSVTSQMDFEGVLESGDSLLAGAGHRVEYAFAPDQPSREFFFSTNKERRLSSVKLSVAAESFNAAERTAHDLVMPVLSRMAFEADVPVEVKGTVIKELTTSIVQMGAVLIGMIKDAPEFSDVLTPELRPFVAAYREGLNCNSPSYQALAFYKILEGAKAFQTKRERAAIKARDAAPPDPMAELMPARLEDVPDAAPWSRDQFAPYLGKSFQDVKDTLDDVIRNAVAHLTPGRDLRVPDYMQDVEKCREVVPVLRYIARRLIVGEIAHTP